MRFTIMLLAAVLLTSGCTLFKRGDKARETKPAKEPTRKKASAAASPKVTASESTNGKVAYVNVPARFVVLNFPIGKIPAMDQKMTVYRQGQKVGEVKINGPQRDTNIVADIVSGEAQTGDEVRPQ